MKETIKIQAELANVPARTYKDKVFRMLYKEKKEFLELYNAMNESDYDNPNMPLRDLLYVADIYSNLTKDENLYGQKLVQIPEPKFVVFYNGTGNVPERSVLKLSDMYGEHTSDVALELKTLVLNINLGYNQELMERCKTLHDYAVFVDLIRQYAKKVPLKQAVENVVTECIERDVLAEFLRRNRAEVMKMSIYEYDEEKHMQQERRDAREEGVQQGIHLLNHLNQLLAEQGRTDDIVKAALDKDYQKKMLEEFGLM